MTPREVLARHTSRELSNWRAFFRVEPTGWDALNTHQAAISIRQSPDRKARFSDYLLTARAVAPSLEDAPALDTGETLKRLGFS